MAKLISADLTNNKLCILEYTTTDGQMLSFKEDAFDAKIVSHTYTDIGKVIFDKPITRIGERAFYNCTSLKEFKGKFAADGGRCLIIDGVLNAFALGCGVTQYTIPNSVTTIGYWAFAYCESLTSVTIGNSVTTIGYAAFYECKSLKNITIGKGVSEIGKQAFKECNIDTIVCCPKIPPKIDDSFGKFENLIVPTGCEEAYANSDWGQYLE